MYAQSDIRFTDPFVSRDSLDWQSRRSDPHYLPLPDFNRALTPPPEMNGGPVTYPCRSGYYTDEHPLHYGDSMPPYQASRTGPGPHLPQEATNAEFGRPGIYTQPSSRSMSPACNSRQTTVDDSHSYSHQSKTSRSSSIAPSFQIPKTVNDSGGSLAELAAQVGILRPVTTCE